MSKKLSPVLIERNGRVASVVKASLAAKGWSHGELARQLGGSVSSSTVNHWVHAHNGIADKYRAQVAKLLDVQESALIAQERTPKGRPPKVTVKSRDQLPALYQPAKQSSNRPASGQVAVMIMPLEQAEAFMLKLLKGT
jgi:hypothetical protein